MLRRILSMIGLGGPQALDPEAFTSLASEVFQKQAPKYKIEIVAPLQFTITPPDGAAQTVFLDNLYRACCANPSGRNREIARFAQVMLQGVTAEVVLPKNVLPLVRDESMIGEMEAHLTNKSQPDKKPKLAAERLGADLVIIYVCDNPQTIQYLTTEDTAELNLSGRSLRELATDNLKDALPEIKSEGANGFFLFSAGGCYEPSLLLMDRIWKKFRTLVQGEIVFSIPTRDALFVADSSVHEALAHLKIITPELYSTQPYHISDKLYVLRSDGISFFDESLIAPAAV
jgi:hypothetical protein